MDRAQTPRGHWARDPSPRAAVRRAATSPTAATDYAALLRIQRMAGNQTAAAAVQRWREKKDQAALVRDGVKGDLDAIEEIQDFSTVSEVDRLTMVFYLTDQFWVRSASEQALERI